MTILNKLPDAYHIYKAKDGNEVEVLDKASGGHWLLRTVSEGNRVNLVDPSGRLYALSKQHGYDYEVLLSNSKVHVDRDSYFNSLSYVFVTPSGLKCSVKSKDYISFVAVDLDTNGVLASYNKPKPGLHIHKHSSLKLSPNLSDHDKLLLILVSLLMGKIERQAKPHHHHPFKQLLPASSSQSSLSSLTSLSSLNNLFHHSHSSKPRKQSFQ
ncbi:hypothetical protein E3P99_03802 [Wallemia hederae]|uniref:Uncharacterized protein n=1 Tax=Wallemia hederae TaxID=1540922 RepID=A0A4T0FD23_9BASI|nr:hypothetical protein E3P99_03802 [Wallemia hederae]